MYRNFLIIAWRNLLKNKLFSFINISGLAIGLAACLLILQYVNLEKSYDSFHANKDDIYRVTLKRAPGGQPPIHSAMTFAPLGKALQQDVPEVTGIARLAPAFGNPIFSYGNTHVAGEKWFFADKGMFDLFSFKLLKGNVQTAFSKPNQIVLTESLARKYFGAEDPLGKVMRLKDLSTDRPYEVSGVMADVPVNSHIQFGALVSFETMYKIDDDLDREWNWNDFYTYMGLAPGTEIAEIENKLSAVLFTHKGDILKERGIKETLHLQKLSDIHLHSALQGEIGENGSYKMVYFLALIAGFILIVAWLNYINLSTAKYAERAREIGIRKLTGATRMQLIRQFLLETFIVKVLSSIMAITFIQLLLPAFRQLTGSPVPSLVQSLSIWGMLAVFMLVGTLLAGVYPAFVLSSFQPIAVLKGKMSHLQGAGIRKILVVFQFATSISLIIGTGVVLMQVRYMQDKNLGINMEQVLIVKGPSALKDWDKSYSQNYAKFKSEAEQYPGIVHLSASDFIPGKMLHRSYIRHANSDPKEALSFYVGSTDSHFLQTYKLKMLAGQNFPEVSTSSIPQVIINQTAAKQLGFSNPQEAVGGKVVALEMDEKQATAQIIGVVQDFHYSSLKEKIEPTVFYFHKASPYFYSIKINSQNITASVAHIEKLYKQAYLDNPFTYYFLDESFNALYTQEVKFGQMVALFSGLAVFVACLGLLGLSYYTISRRTKEIGIRKVLGATVPNITLFLSRDFLKLIIIANLIAWPLAYAGMNQWLQSYAFRININPWLFIWPSLIVLLMAMLTIGIQTIKAASANPVNSLRNE